MNEFAFTAQFFFSSMIISNFVYKVHILMKCDDTVVIRDSNFSFERRRNTKCLWLLEFGIFHLFLAFLRLFNVFFFHRRNDGQQNRNLY